MRSAVSLTNDTVLTAIVVLSVSMSGGALLLDAYDVIGMPFTISALALPGFVLTLALGVWAGRVGRTVFLRRLYVGLIAGLIAVLAYDGLRGVIMVAVPGDFNPFRSHPNFGALILDTSPDTKAAMAAGWIYHVWNGISFAVMYTMVAGGSRMYWAFLWAMALETVTVIVYPNLFEISRVDSMFIVVSFAGHAMYGTTLGVLSRNWLRWPERDGSVWRLRLPSIKEGFA